MNSMKKRNALPGADDVLRREMDNGITVLARQNDSSRTVSLIAHLPGGTYNEPDEVGGVNRLMMSLLSSGTEYRDSDQINDYLETIGAAISFSSHVHGYGMGIACLVEDFEPVLALAMEMLRVPTFPEHKFIQRRDQTLASLRYRDHDTGAMAARLMRKLYYGTHPYSKDMLGTPESLAALNREILAERHRAAIRPQGVILSICGGLESEAAFDSVARVFGSWTAEPGEGEGELIDAVPPEKPIRDHVEIAGMSQLDFQIGFAGPTTTSPDYEAVRLGDCVLGQFGMMGRLGSVVRDQHGLAYSIGSGNRGTKLGGLWSISAGVNPENLERALDLTLAEVKRFTDTPVTDEELDDVRSYLKGVMPLMLESNRGMAEAILSAEHYQLGLDYYRDITAKLAKISAEEIQAVARKYLSLEHMAIATAGTLAKAGES